MLYCMIEQRCSLLNKQGFYQQLEGYENSLVLGYSVVWGDQDCFCFWFYKLFYFVLQVGIEEYYLLLFVFGF